MRIIVVLYRYVPSGADTVRVRAYMKNFVSLGYSVELVTNCDSNVQINLAPVKVHLINSKKKRTFLQQRISDGYKMVKMAKNIAEKGDVIFCYSVPIFGLLFPRKYNVFYEETEIPTQVGEENCFRKIITWVRVRTINKAAGLCVISNALKDFYISRGVKPEHIIVANMFVDIARFEGLKKTVTKYKYFAYCGSLSNHKDGLDLLIKAFYIVQQAHPEVHLAIAGVFPRRDDEITDTELVRNLGLNDSVHFLGMVTSEKLPQFLLNAEALVLARPNNRQAKYGFPTKLGEYLLTGNPVVVTRVGDIPCFLKDNESAFIAEPGDVENIASKMIESIESQNAKKVGLCGRDIALSNFDSNIVSRAVVNFFN